MSLFEALGGAETFTPPTRDHRYKLDGVDVAQIRALYAKGVPQKRLARQFGVSQPQISKIVRGLQWATGN